MYARFLYLPNLYTLDMKKLKRLFLICFAVLVSNALMAQAFDDGKNFASAGFGFPATSEISQTLTQYSNQQDYDYKNYGTIVLKYEHGFAKYFGAGINLEYSTANVNYNYTVTRVFNTDTTYKANENSTTYGFYLRLNGHFPIGDKLDLFAGVGLGYLLTLDNSSDNNPKGPVATNFKNQTLNFNGQFTLGARYMIKEHFGLFAEVGSASTNVQVGIVLGF